MRNKYSVSAVIEDDVSIGEGSFVWYFAHVCAGVKMGKNCSIGEKSYLGKNVILGDNVKIGNNTNIYEGAIIKDDVFIGNNVSFTNVRKPVAYKKGELRDTIVEEKASIGANATIVAGVKIGKGSQVGDGAVVIKNVPEGCVAVGNPAHIVKKNHAI